MLVFVDHLHGGHTHAHQGLPADLAKVTSPSDMPDADKDDAVIVAFRRAATFNLGNTKSDITHNRRSSCAIGSPASWTRPVYVKSDGRAKYGVVVKVVDEIRAAVWITSAC